MRRITTLIGFLIRDLFGSAAGIVPLGAALAFGLIAFEYGMDQAQFVTVAGLGTGVLCLLTTLLLAGRAEQPAFYLLLVRLHRRAELLVALLLGGLIVTGGLAALIAGVNLLAGRLVLDFPSALWIAPTWLPLWLLGGTLGLALSSLVERGGSHLVGWALLAALLVVNDRKALLAGLDWLVRGVTAVLWPVSTLLARASAGEHGRLYFQVMALTWLYAALLLALAVQLFAEKDLLGPGGRAAPDVDARAGEME